MNKPKATGNDVREIRKELGWTLQQMADHWELSRPTVVKWEGWKEQLTPKPVVVGILLADLRRTHLAKPQQESTDEH